MTEYHPVSQEQSEPLAKMPLFFLPGFTHPTQVTPDNPLGDYAPVAEAFDAAGFDFRLISTEWAATDYDDDQGPLDCLRNKTETAILDDLVIGGDEEFSMADEHPFWLGGFSLGALIAIQVAMDYGNNFMRGPNYLQGVLAYSPAPFHIDSTAQIDSFTLFLSCLKRRLYPTDYPLFTKSLVRELNELPPVLMRHDVPVHVTLGENELPLNHVSALLLSRIADSDPQPGSIGIIPGVRHNIRERAYYEPAAKIAQLALEGLLSDARDNPSADNWMARIMSFYPPDQTMSI
jgi:hypothetical protein